MEKNVSENLTVHQVQNINEMKIKPKRIVCAVGTGVSMTGIIKGLIKYDLKIPVLGVLCAKKSHAQLRDNLLKEFGQYHFERYITLEKCSEELQILPDHFPELDHEYEMKCFSTEPSMGVQPMDLLWLCGLRKHIHILIIL